MALPLYGLSRRFDPRRLSGLLVWLDAGDSSTLFDATTGGSVVAADAGVARWADKSGHNNHATQTITNNRPLRRVAQFAGRDALEFDGGNDALTIANDLSTPNGASIVIVSDKDGSGQTSGLYTFNGQTGAPGNNHHGFTSLGNYYDGFGVAGSRPEFAQAERLDRYVYGVTASSAPVYTAYLDGEQRHTQSGGSLVAASLGSGHSIGSGRKDLGGLFFDGWICEVLIYSRVLTATEMRWLYQQLRARWATT